MNDTFEEKLLSLSEKTFDTQLKEIDTDVLRQLRQARQNAVAVALKQVSAQSPAKSPISGNVITINFPSWLSPVSTAAAFASIAIVASSLWLQPQIQTELNVLPLEDISMLTTSDEFELYENLDFYIWLENEDSAS